MRVRPRVTSAPSPPAPTRPASTTMASDSRMHWLRPTRSVGLAEGISILNRMARGEAPVACPSSSRSLRHLVERQRRQSQHRRHAVNDRRDDGRHAAEAEDHHGGNEIDPGRHGLHHVEHGPDRRLEPSVARCQDAERERDRDRNVTATTRGPASASTPSRGPSASRSRERRSRAGRPASSTQHAGEHAPRATMTSRRQGGKSRAASMPPSTASIDLGDRGEEADGRLVFSQSTAGAR